MPPRHDSEWFSRQVICWQELKRCCKEYYTQLSRTDAATAAMASAPDCGDLWKDMLKTWSSLNPEECSSVSASSYPPTVLTRQLAVLWDMLSTWAVISPLQIGHSAKLRPVLWRAVFRPMLLHLESCKLVFLAKYEQAEGHREGATSRQQKATFSVAEILSQRALSFLTDKWESAMRVDATEATTDTVSGLGCPSGLINGSSGDDLYDAIHADLILRGVCPTGLAGKYWIATIFGQCPHGRCVTQLALMQIVTHTSHMVEYSTWPIAYTCSLIESIVSVVSKTETAGATPASSRSVIHTIQEKSIADMCVLNGGTDKRRFLQSAAANCLC